MILTSDYSSEDIDAARKMYEESFPLEERRDWNNLVDSSSNGDMDLLIVKEAIDGMTAGLVTVWHLPSADYVEHFAISAALRGCGIGSCVIDEVVHMAGNRAVILEVEPPETTPMAMRRIGFYRSHGFELIDFDYKQPPYGKGLPWVPLKLMSTAPVDVRNIQDELYRIVYGVSHGRDGNAVFRDIGD